MPYVENRGVLIHYEVEGEGPPLVLAHGFSDTLEGWREYGYAAELEKEHRLVPSTPGGTARATNPTTPKRPRAWSKGRPTSSPCSTIWASTGRTTSATPWAVGSALAWRGTPPNASARE